MASEVGSGQVAIFPVFKGFRRAVDAEVDSSSKSASSRFATGFRSAGDTAGKSFATGFKTATSGISADALKKASADVAAASRAVSAARLKELDATGKLRLAETQLTDARSRFAAGSVQVVRAEERLASVQRAVAAAEANTTGATDRLAAAKRNLAVAANQASVAGQRVSSTFAQLPNVLGPAGGASARRFSQGFLDVLGGALGANIITGIGFTIGRGINQGIVAGLGFAIGGVGLASELEQSVGAVESVFKAHSGVITGFAAEAVETVGLSRAAYQKFATVVGAQLKNLRVPFDQVAGKTDDLITLGADLAAQFGGSTSDAVQALSSLLRGERDPIERYGVSIKQADINARLASQGLKGLTGDALRQAEIQATLAILWEQTADAQGTFFRESDTYAHQQQVLNAALEETQTKLGQFLLPAFTSMATFANDTLLPRFDEIIERVGPRLGGALEASAPKVQLLLDKVSPLVEDFLVWGGTEGIPGVIDNLDSLADAVPGWVAAMEGLNEVGTWLDNLNDGIATFADSINGENGLLVDLFNGAAESAETFFSENTLEGAGSDWATSFGTGVTSSTEDVLQSATGVGQTAIDAVDPFAFESFGSGQNFGDSLAKGIKSKQIKVGLAAFAVAKEADRQFKSGLGIASPSKVGLEDGANYGDSIATGISSSEKAVRDASAQLVAATRVVTSAAASSTVSTVSAGASSSGDRPIYADTGALIGWMSEIADGRSRIVFNTSMDAIKTEVLAGGAA